ncbi:MAG TPA: CehA/McbA family metallohydrolase [Syntrophomonadaceae bacterium]|nr:CehA/McbA family metallohydrolase [Syntrophomonadaceae bacterium]
MFEYIGNVHIHSAYSDGTYEIDKIAKLANKAKLDFIVIADHETLEGLHNGEEGYKHGALTLIGEEVNDTCNHYLALDIDKVVPNNTENPQAVIDEVNAQGGFGIIAHPVEKGSPIYRDGITYNWTDFNVTGFQGIEIWNYLSQWKGGIKNVFLGIYLVFNPHPALHGPYPEVMKWLDELQTQGKQIAVFGGSDAHNVKIGIGPLTLVTFGPYYYSFKCINMHILTTSKLTGEYHQDKKLVYSALRHGNSWVSYDFFKNSKGFRFNLKFGKRSYSMGDMVKYEKGMTFEIKFPYKCKATIIKDGKVWKELHGDNYNIKVTEKGVYRIEAYHKKGLSYRPWIFSNSIWLV